MPPNTSAIAVATVVGVSLWIGYKAKRERCKQAEELEQERQRVEEKRRQLRERSEPWALG